MKNRINEIDFEVKKLREQIFTLLDEKNNIKAKCQHKFIRISDSAACSECNYDGGWWCPESPTHLCSYEKHNPDCCDYCGYPEERK